MKYKTLMVHNHYRSGVPSGEGAVVESEIDLLKRYGHSVSSYFRHSDELVEKGFAGQVAGAMSVPWNPFSATAIKKELFKSSPDVVHVHNTFPLISPSIFKAIGSTAARVLTLHNYRLFCSAAIPLRDSRVCTECIDGHTAMPSIKYGCYRNSRLATLPLAFGIGLNRRLGTWLHHVDAFIALTEFQRELMIKAGLPAELVHVKPNFFPGKPEVLPWKERSKSVVFAGRITAEKGVEALVRAWLAWGAMAPELRIVGDGELKDKLSRLASTQPEVPIKFLGQLSSNDAQKEIAQSRLLIIPSEWFEGFPMVVREAFAFGTPVAAARIGSLSSIVQEGINGVLFAPGDVESLLDSVKPLWDAEESIQQLALGARRSFETLYTEEANYQLLMNIYQRAIDVSHSRKSM